MNFLTWLSRKRYPYQPLIEIEISRSNLINNLNEFKKLTSETNSITQSIHNHTHHNLIAPVLKSNAYGHGLFEVADILEHQHIPFFIVDSYFEALALRSHGFQPKILIIGYTRPEIMLSSKLRDVSFTVSNLETLKDITYHEPQEWSSVEGKIGLNKIVNSFRPHILNIHLKINTGMHRQGILVVEVDQAMKMIKADGTNRHPVVLEGICSHFSDASNIDESFTESQIHIWNKIVETFKKNFYHSLKYIHLANTDGQLFSNDIMANVTRLGIGLYGITDNPKILNKLNLKPVLKMKTIITSVKKLKKGETVGYANTFVANHDMIIANIAAGYFEGVDRRLSNKGSLLVGSNNVICPIIGRVSMNITTIDVSKVFDVEIGTEVTIISDNPQDPNSIVSIAKICDTIGYEIAVHLERSVKRVVVD